MNFFNYNIDKKYIKYFLILGWISIWSTISFNPIDFVNFKTIHNYRLDDLNYSQLINLLRGTSTLIYFPLVIFIFLSFVKKSDVIKKTNIIFFFLIFFFLIQLIGLYKTNNPNENIYFIISSINVVITSFLFKNLFNTKELRLILKLTTGIAGLIFLFFTYKYFYTVFQMRTNFYGAWGSVQFGIFEVPRPTGLSRIALIIFIMTTNLSFKNKRYDNFNLYFSILLVALIFLFASRTMIFILFVYLFIYIFYYKIYTFKKISGLIKNFLIFPLITIFIFMIIQNVNFLYFENKIGNPKVVKKLDESSKSQIFGSLFLLSPQVSRQFPGIKEKRSSAENFSSGRKEDWLNIIRANKNIFLGNGPLGDRYLIRTSASSLIMSTYASSGLIGIFLIIYISLLTLHSSVQFIFKNKRYNFYKDKFIASAILICLMLRSILESSYSVFSIDLIFFSLCVAIFNYKKENEK
jgi:hypothetical protein